MSDWSKDFESEDIIWHEFGETFDCLVPHRNGDGGTTRDDVILTNGQLPFSPSSIGTKDSFGHSLNKLVPPVDPSTLASSVTHLAFQGGQMSNMCFNQYNMNLGKNKLPSENHISLLGTIDRSEICNASLDNASSADNGLAFLKNGNQREDDFLYHDWSDISNFDDIDKMFRNCDPTFGQHNKTDCKSWISSSSNDIFGSEDTFQSGLQSSSLDLSTINDTPSQLAEISLPENGLSAAHKRPCLGHPSFKLLSDGKQSYDDDGRAGFESAATQVSNENSLDDRSGFNLINEQIKQSEGQYSSKVERKYQNQSNASTSYSNPSHMEQFVDQKPFPSVLTSPDDYSFQPSTKHAIFTSFESSIPMFKSHLQVQENPSLHKDIFLEMAPIMVPAGNNKSSPYEVSGHICSALSHHAGTFSSGSANFPDKKLKDVVEKQGVGTLKQVTSVVKQEKDCKQDLGSNRGRISAELVSGTSNASAAYESSSMPSFYYSDISVKAISFKRLQDVIAQLDIKTKLCIRDSLYRLARSAEQRHTSNGSTGNIKEAYGTVRQRNGDHRNAESETNPIDRSIANLLFHRPPETA